MPEMACPNGHGTIDVADDDLAANEGKEPGCSECGARLIPAAAIVAVPRQVRHLVLAYVPAVLSADDAIPDMALTPEDGEGELSALVFTIPDHSERYVVLVGDAQAQVIIRGLVARHTPQPFGSSIIVPDTIPPGL